MTTPHQSGLIVDDQLKNLQKQIASHPQLRVGWEQFDRKMKTFDEDKLAGYDRFWQEADARARECGGVKLFTRGNFLRNVAHQAVDLAFHYRMTQDKASLHAALTLARLPLAESKWLAQGTQNGWGSDLWTADFSTSLGLVFNFLRQDLSQEELSLWRTSLAVKGIAPILADWISPKTRIHALDSMGHNWWSVCVGGAAIALFSIRDSHAGSDEQLQVIADDFVEFFNYPGNILQNKGANFGRGGDYIESIGYLDYALQNLIPLLDPFREQLGRDLAAEIPVLEKICDYYVASIQPLEGHFYRLNFGNMGSGAETMGAYNHHPTASWLWLAVRFQREDLFHLVCQSHPQPSTFFEFLFWPGEMKGASFQGAPGSTIFENNGQAILRDGYEKTSTVFAIRAGEKWNHNHSDAGSFILSSAGREFIIDSGTTEYSNPQVYDYFKPSEGHNVILHDGRGQNNELDFTGTKFKGSIAASLFAPGYQYVLADATGPWEGVYQRYYRHVLWIEDFIVLVDDLMAAHVAPLTQLLHYRGTAESAHGLTRIDNQGKVLAIHHLIPVPARFETRTGQLSSMRANPLKYEYQIEDIPYLAVHYSGSARREKILQVLELPDGTEKKIEKIELPGISQVRITTVDGQWDIFCNHDADGRKMHQNSIVSLENGLHTDAFLVVMHRSPAGRLFSFTIHNGSFLRSGEAVLYNSLLKGDAHVVYQSDRIEFHTSLTSGTSIDFSTEKSPANLRRFRLEKGARKTIHCL